MARTGIQGPGKGHTNIAPTPPGTNSRPPLAVVPCTRVDPLLWTWLGVAGDAYRRESGDASPNYHNLARVRECWGAGADHMMLWLLVRDDEAFGYAITEVCRSFRRECYISEAWINPAMRNLGAIRMGMVAFEAWARAKNCAVVRFTTFRSARAYARALAPLGWRRAETAFAKPLEAPRG